jgi:hypothetical protein
MNCELLQGGFVGLIPQPRASRENSVHRLSTDGSLLYLK